MCPSSTFRWIPMPRPMRRTRWCATTSASRSPSRPATSPAELLVPNLRNRLEVFISRVAPTAGNVARTPKTESEECLYVMEGTLRVVLHDQEYLLAGRRQHLHPRLRPAGDQRRGRGRGGLLVGDYAADFLIMAGCKIVVKYAQMMKLCKLWNGRQPY